MKPISILLTEKEVAELKKTYQVYQENPKQYELYRFKLDDATIIIYQTLKAVFTGKDAELIAQPYQKLPPNRFPQVGSDEVGTGDYFGPVVVVAAYLDSKSYQALKKYPIADSKTLSDPEILKFAPVLIKNLKHSLLILPPEKYNEITKQHNLNAIKALLHNQAILNLEKKLKGLPKLVVVDKFTTINSYFRYLKNEPEIYQKITFTTQAESKYFAVAAASIIARYIFLKELDKLNDKYNFVFPKGAGAIVDEKGKEFLERHSDLSQVAKLHFKNTSRILPD